MLKSLSLDRKHTQGLGNMIRLKLDIENKSIQYSYIKGNPFFPKMHSTGPLATIVSNIN